MPDVDGWQEVRRGGQVHGPQDAGGGGGRREGGGEGRGPVGEGGAGGLGGGGMHPQHRARVKTPDIRAKVEPKPPHRDAEL